MRASLIVPCYVTCEELWQYTQTCVTSQYNCRLADDEIVLIDNGSEDLWYDEFFHWSDIYIRNRTNLGFAPAVNQGLKLATCEWLVVCNNDIEFLDDWIGNAIANWEPDTGIISSHLLAHDPERKAG